MKTLKQLNKNFCSTLLILVVLLLSISSVNATKPAPYVSQSVSKESGWIYKILEYNGRKTANEFGGKVKLSVHLLMQSNNILTLIIHIYPLPLEM